MAQESLYKISWYILDLTKLYRFIVIKEKYNKCKKNVISKVIILPLLLIQSYCFIKNLKFYIKILIKFKFNSIPLNKIHIILPFCGENHEALQSLSASHKD